MPVIDAALIFISAGLLLIALELGWRIRRAKAINRHEPLIGKHVRHTKTEISMRRSKARHRRVKPHGRHAAPASV